MDLCRFQAKQTFTLATEASSRWISQLTISYIAKLSHGLVALQLAVLK